MWEMRRPPAMRAAHCVCFEPMALYTPAFLPLVSFFTLPSASSASAHLCKCCDPQPIERVQRCQYRAVTECETETV